MGNDTKGQTLSLLLFPRKVSLHVIVRFRAQGNMAKKILAEHNLFQLGNFCWQKNFSAVLLRFILCKHSSLFFTVSPRGETEGKKQAKAPVPPSLPRVYFHGRSPI